MPIRVSICSEGSQLAIDSVLQWLLSRKAWISLPRQFNGVETNSSGETWSPTNRGLRTQETTPVLTSISRLTATSSHQLLANSMLTLLWAISPSRWLPQVPFHKITLLGLQRAYTALQKSPKRRKTTKRRVLNNNFLFANWKRGNMAQGSQVR